MIQTQEIKYLLFSAEFHPYFFLTQMNLHSLCIYCRCWVFFIFIFFIAHHNSQKQKQYKIWLKIHYYNGVHFYNYIYFWKNSNFDPNTTCSFWLSSIYISIILIQMNLHSLYLFPEVKTNVSGCSLWMTSSGSNPSGIALLDGRYRRHTWVSIYLYMALSTDQSDSPIYMHCSIHRYIINEPKPLLQTTSSLFLPRVIIIEII